MGPSIMVVRPARRWHMLAAGVLAGVAILGASLAPRAHHAASRAPLWVAIAIEEAPCPAPIAAPRPAPAPPVAAATDDCGPALAAWYETRRAARAAGTDEADPSVRAERERAIDACLTR
ncbi:MAG TPA: hypothetical protein VHE35_28980 [Kofleriaceae bacterium]|nr:hypothetical protein [Kofleriaceae bacterium]